MSSELGAVQELTLQEWVKTVPASQMVFPDTFFDRIKYMFWRIYTPLHPLVRDTALKLGLSSQSDTYPQGRQPYVLGTLPQGVSVQEFVTRMIAKGFGNHFVAWEDRGQLVSLRLVDDFKYQYHLRVFEDGEVRGHYEYTPECHPIAHLKGDDFEPRREKFLEFLGDDIVVSQS